MTEIRAGNGSREGRGSRAGDGRGGAPFATRLLAWYEIWRREGFAPLRAAWLARAVGVGQAVEVRLDRETLTGRFEALDETGALALALPEGGRRLVAAGDVFFPAS